MITEIRFKTLQMGLCKFIFSLCLFSFLNSATVLTKIIYPKVHFVPLVCHCAGFRDNNGSIVDKDMQGKMQILW